MHRPILFLGICVCLVTAFALIVVAGLRSPAAIAQPPAAYEGITRGFYAAVNTAIATGNTSLVRAYVDEELFTGEGLPGVASGRDGLEAALADLHVTAPNTRFGIDDLAISGDQVTIELAIQRDQDGSFLGIPLLSQPLPGRTVDVIRIRGGEIVEQSNLLDETGSLRPTGSRSLQLRGPLRLIVTLERVTLPPEQAYSLAEMPIVRALITEAGTVSVELTALELRVEGEARRSYPSTTVLDLANEEIILASTEKQVTVTNRGHTDASLIHVSLDLPVRGQAAAPDNVVQPGNIKHQVLTGGIPVHLPAGALGLAAGRVVLAPGAELALGATEGVALVQLESGEASVSHQGSVRFRRSDGLMLTGVGTERLDASEGMLIDPGASVTLRNDGAEIVQGLVVTITETENP